MADPDYQHGPLPGRGVTLYRHVLTPTAPPWARVAVVHGYGDHGARYLHLLRYLADQSILAASFDYRGHGRATGRRAYARDWAEYLDDLDTFLDALRPLGDQPLFLVAHSHGGLIAAAAGIDGRLRDRRVAGVVFSAPYFAHATPVGWHKNAFAAVADHVLPWCLVSNGLRPEMLSSDPEMIDDSINDKLAIRCATPRWWVTVRRKQSEVMKRAADFRHPMLMLVAGRDPIASPAASEAFFAAAASPGKRVERYPEMVHEILRERGRNRVFAAILDWIRQRTPQADLTPR